jgi:hypothetical protein
LFPEFDNLFDIRNFEVKYWHRSTYDTLSRFTCERSFNYANPKLFTGVCNGKIPNIDNSLISFTDDNLVLKNKFMYHDEVKPQLIDSTEYNNLDFEFPHRNKNKTFIFRNKYFRFVSTIYQKILFKFYY